MKAVIHINPASQLRPIADAMQAGLERHGIAVTNTMPNKPQPCDFAVVWGARQDKVFAAGPPVLVMERGHVGARMTLVSVGWDGLARRCRYPVATDGGARWRERYGSLMQPWRRLDDGHALIIGQVDSDASLTLQGLKLKPWATEVAVRLTRLGWSVRYRPHPLGDGWVPPGVARSSRETPLEADLAGAAVCVTYNSTTGVEAVLAGVPTMTLDEGAMAWPVASHGLAEPLVTPDRDAWAADLAWCQWSVEELASGAAWEAVAPLMHGRVAA
jgi:hypothetical protein